MKKKLDIREEMDEIKKYTISHTSWDKHIINKPFSYISWDKFITFFNQYLINIITMEKWK